VLKSNADKNATLAANVQDMHEFWKSTTTESVVWIGQNNSARKIANFKGNEIKGSYRTYRKWVFRITRPITVFVGRFHCCRHDLISLYNAYTPTTRKITCSAAETQAKLTHKGSKTVLSSDSTAPAPSYLEFATSEVLLWHKTSLSAIHRHWNVHLSISHRHCCCCRCHMYSHVVSH